MVAILKSCVVVPLLLWALLLPKLGAILLDLHPGVEMTVICTGTSMVTLRIGPDGTPIEVDYEEDAPCVMADPSDLERVDIPDWVYLARSYQTPFHAVPNRLAQHDAGLVNRDSQAPPRA